MAINIVEAVQAKLGIASIKKIDVNAMHQSDTTAPLKTDHASQAATAAVLVAIYKLCKTDEGAANIAQGGSGNWLETIFRGREEMAIEKVANYGDSSIDEARNLMQRTADAAVQIVHDGAGANPTAAKVKAYIASQRHNILVYLPAELEMSKVLDDTTLDDRTNKMEGPVSSFLHWIENLMAPGDKTNDEAFRRDDEFFTRKNR
jgi:hypothetical protein